MDETVVIKQSFFKQLFLVFLGIIMVWCSLSILFIKHTVICSVIGIMGVLFFGICLLFIMKRLIMPKDILSIDPHGFIDNSSAMSSGKMICWSDVESIEISSVFFQKFVCVKLRNPNEFLREITPIKKTLTKANLTCSFDIIQITLNSANANYKEVYQIMNDYWLAHQSK